MAKYYAINPNNAEYYEKNDGSRVWELSRADAMKMSEFAMMVALDERNFNESLNVYWQQQLFEQLSWDPHNGWTS